MNQIKVGALLSYVNIALYILIGIVYVPLLLHFLSIEEYGLYQLIGSLVAYLSIMDFGLNGTITRYYSQRVALDDKKGQENTLAIAMILYLAIDVLVIIAGIILIINLDILFGNVLSPQEMISAKAMMVLLIINIAVSIPSHVYTSAITSYEKFVFLRIITIIRSLINPVIVLVILRFKAEALSIVKVQVALNFIAIFCHFLYARKGLKIKIHLHYFDKILVKSMFRFAFYIFLNVIVDQVYWKTGHLILGAVSGTAAVAIFSVAIQISLYFMNISTTLNSVLLPRVSKIVATTDDMDELNSMFIKIGRLQYVSLGLILTGFFIFGRMFLMLWVGDTFLDAYLMVLVIIIPFTIDLIQNMGIIILQAKNMHAFRAKLSFVIALANILFSIPLAKRYGGLGCAIVTGGCLFIGNGIITNIYYMKIGIQVVAFFKDILNLSKSVLLAGIIGYLIIKILPFSGWLFFCIGVTAYTVLYILIIWFLGLNNYEKQLILSILFSVIGRKYKKFSKIIR